MCHADIYRIHATADAAPAALALLRTLGGQEAVLHAVTAPAGEFAATPTTVEVRLAPVLLRQRSTGTELLVAAHTITDAALSNGFADAPALLAATTKVEIAGASYRNTTYSADTFARAPYLFRLQLAP